MWGLKVTIEEAEQGIIEEFSGLEDWLDKYQYLIRLGKQHPGLDDSSKTDEHAVAGCQSQVWIVTRVEGGRLYFQADSDSLIIKAILALLLRVVSGQRPEAISSARLHFMDRIGLSTHLSPSRANGLATVVRHIQQCAARSV